MQLGDSGRFFLTQLKFLKELGGEELALVTLKKFRWNKQEKSWTNALRAVFVNQNFSEDKQFPLKMP